MSLFFEIRTVSEPHVYYITCLFLHSFNSLLLQLHRLQKSGQITATSHDLTPNGGFRSHFGSSILDLASGVGILSVENWS